ncbi:MAG: PQQ-dependent sugar dehydrogenase [Bacteroidota bacterium]
MAPPPGLTNPQAIGAYLNGVFPDTPPSVPTGFATNNAFPNISFNSPFKIIKDPRGDRFFVAEKRGRISIFSTANGGSNYETVVDFQDLVSQGGGTHGLMGFVLHPEFGQAGSPNRNYFYVFYRHLPAGENPASETNSYRRLSRFTINDGTNQADRSSELILIHQFVRSRIHSGGGMIFDNDGFLFVGLGDGGNCCEQFSTQRLDRWLLGGVIKIDVDKRGGNISHPIRRQPTNYEDSVTPSLPIGWEDSYSQGYYIPNSNPWQDPSGGTLEEFYALGLRHAYTLVYDSLKNEVWEGDIGQGTWEEVNKIKKGHNYEWPFLEADKVHRATLSFTPQNINEVTGPRQGPHIKLNRATSNSVITGLVYRGSKYPSLQGKLLFADHGRGTIYSIDTDSPSNLTQDDIELVATLPGTSMGFGIASFATDDAGEIYLVKLDGVNYNPTNDIRDGGTIHKIIPQFNSTTSPALLSQTGAFSNLANLTPSSGIIPYTVNSPLWSDHAKKKRWIALPNDGSHDTAAEKIVFSKDNLWQFPSGTVLIKHFELPIDAQNPSLTRRLETRFIVIDKTGDHYGLTYKWNDAQTDARLLSEGEDVDIDVQDINGITQTQTWTFPSPSDCMTCHTQVAGRVLGVNTHQLNGDLTYESGIISNQLETWSHLGMFDTPITDPTDYFSSVDLADAKATSSNKIYSYLDANCGHCHHPQGVEGAFDARYHVLHENRAMINQVNTGENSVSGGVVVKPGVPVQSELFIRDNAVGGVAMPPLAKNIIDQPYIDELENWIEGLEENLTDFDRIGEVGQIQNDHTWATVNLKRTYVNPVVVVGAISYNGEQQGFPRVRNVGPSSFEVKVEEWECMDLAHLVERMNYMVVEAGRHRLSNGKYLEAGNLENVDHNWKSQSYSEAFTTKPILLAQITTNNEAAAIVRLNHSVSNATGFRALVQNSKKTSHAAERISWVAIEGGNQATGFAYEMGRMSSVDEAWKYQAFELSYAYKPLFLGFISSYLGSDPVALRYDEERLTGKGVKLFTQEEECSDAELDHTFETIDYFVFERAGFLLGYKNPKMEIELIAKLEGPYSSSNGLMDDRLSSNQLISATDPYGLGETTTPAILNTTGNQALVDWVKIDARDADDPTNIIASRAVLLQRNGKLITAQGSDRINFENLNPGSYFIVLSHYNHLAVMTANPINFSQNPQLDFSSPTTSLYNPSGAQVLKNEGGVMLLWAGDSNGDGRVNVIDKNLYWLRENGAAYIYGTSSSDYNLDGNINAIDYNLFWRINNSRISEVP